LDNNILPNEDDSSTLFICSGMQRIKPRFLNSYNEKYGSVQSCIRTNDLELVGDGTHLTNFKMVGNFSFNCNNYEESVEIWTSIIDDLKIKVDSVHIHPSQIDHKKMWSKYEYEIVEDSSCEWSDGNIGGYCCEMYVGELEIGNLVNTMIHSTDVGFGLERLVQVIENKNRVDETSLFDINLHPIVRDHSRTIELFWDNKIIPGNKGREYICRRLVRRLIRYSNDKFIFNDWIESEKELLEKRLKIGRRVYKKYKDRSPEFWWSTYGILPEEMELLKKV
jgi:alanyl-tRNA synthetase